ncbi:diadenylate cyclase [Faecalibacillus intestinalis]|uniref:diadenylate cyclase n=1 Tax=Faecalibacillus intestinalis TaxID=1982626 RepID=UPI003AB5D292
MLLFTENALKETERLHSAGYQVSIREDMNARWIEAIGKIDGAMLLDQYGKLYMVGVILDGEIPAKGVNTSRGARYNSAVKYSYSHKKEKHLLVVISEDGYFDVINYNWLL